MALTDLTETTWKFNDILDFTNIIIETEFHIDFIKCNGISYQSYNNLWYHAANNENYLIYSDGTNLDFAYNASTESWQQSKIIKIIGGTDINNSTFITWLKANAVQLDVTDLTNTAWTFNDAPYFYFETEESDKQYSSFNINFNSNSNSYITLYEELLNSTMLATISYKKVDDTLTQVYSVDLNYWTSSWVDNNYKTIKITGGIDTTNAMLILYLQTFATQIPISAITISYSGSEIATMEESGTKTLLTSGKYCESDIVVEYIKPTSKLQEKTVTPTTEQQIVIPDSIEYSIEIPVGTAPIYYSTYKIRFDSLDPLPDGSGTYSYYGKISCDNNVDIILSGTDTAANNRLPLQCTIVGSTSYKIDDSVTYLESSVYTGHYIKIEFENSAPLGGVVSEEIKIWESSQSDYDGLSRVTINAIPSANGVSF